MSSTGTGQSGIGFIVMNTVAVSEQLMSPSSTRYLTESINVSESSCIYSKEPSILILITPWSGPSKSTEDKSSFSSSVSLDKIPLAGTFNVPPSSTE